MNSVTFFNTGICLICVIFIDSLFSSLKHTKRKICPTEDTKPVLTPGVSPIWTETLFNNNNTLHSVTWPQVPEDDDLDRT